MVVAREKMMSYEEIRQKRVEENKKRMEALNLPQLSSLLHTPSFKPSPRKQMKPRTVEKQLVVVRRSSRVANKPAPVYQEVIVDKVMIPRRVSKHRDLSNRVYASEEARAEALEKAEKLESGLDPHFPVFIKSMLQSHVTGGFWLGLPVHFCKTNLPKRDEVMTLIDEEGHEYPTIYLAKKTGLSGGWKGFAVAHGLVDGDAIVFQLLQRTTFKGERFQTEELRTKLAAAMSEHLGCWSPASGVGLGTTGLDGIALPLPFYGVDNSCPFVRRPA